MQEIQKGKPGTKNRKKHAIKTRRDKHKDRTVNKLKKNLS
jgi:hypothetical protein